MISLFCKVHSTSISDLFRLCLLQVVVLVKLVASVSGSKSSKKRRKNAKSKPKSEEKLANGKCNFLVAGVIAFFP